jgi:hypothetical protein
MAGSGLGFRIGGGVIKLLVTASQFHSEFLVRLRTHLSVSPFR